MVAYLLRVAATQVFKITTLLTIRAQLGCMSELLVRRRPVASACEGLCRGEVAVQLYIGSGRTLRLRDALVGPL
ncbi:MAG: hypothetical protein H7138_10805 [Myxococcales bacterium]|nr:hypothetical protein [Myxococcales bacterium]